jgi:hypothetical protein
MSLGVQASRGLQSTLFHLVKDSHGKSFAMVDVKLLSLAMDLRARAQDILARAETMYDVDAQHTMREVAACHEKFAERVEQHLGAQEL